MQNEQQPGQFYNPEQPTNTGYNSTEQLPAPSEDQDLDDSISWTASEFVQHDKQSTWYMALAVITLSAAIILYLVLGRDVFAPIIVIALGVAFGVAASRKPRVLEYSVNETGLGVGDRHFVYEDFKSFGVLEEGVISSIILMPVKRFSPALVLYVPQDMLDDVLGSLGIFLPMEQHEIGYVDKFLNKIKF